jgi:LPS O-antigen subunit length determinant protein (WzzB/FepE family)
MNTDNFKDFSNDEIDFTEIFTALWKKKLLIFLITSSAAVFSVFYSLSLPNIYISSALLAPSESENSISSLGRLSSLAGMAGLSIPSNSNSKSIEAIERMQSYDFFIDQFLPNIEFIDLVAANNWDKENNLIIYDSDYDPSQSPSKQKAYESYKSILKITKNNRTSYTLIEVEHVSPFIAKSWLSLIINKINSHMREIDKDIAKNSIDFLNTKSQETNLSDIKDVIFGILETQIQTLTLAEANEDYVFKIISSPIVPERKSKPSRSSICIMGTILGFILSIISSLTLHFSSYRKN